MYERDIAEQVEHIWNSRNKQGRIAAVNAMGLNLIFGIVDDRYFSELSQTHQRMLILSATAMQNGLSLAVAENA